MPPTNTNNTPTGSGLKKSDLFDIALKIFGFCFLVTLLIELKQVITFIISAQMMGPMNEAFSSMALVWPYLFTIGIDFLLMWMFLFRTKKILDIVLPKNQSETIEFALNKPVLVQVAAIITGGLLIVGAVEKTGRSIIGMVQIAGTPFEASPTAITELLWQIVIGIGGYALIAASGWIAQRFSGKTTVAKNDSEEGGRFLFGQWKIAPTTFKKKRPLMPKRKQQTE